VPFCLGRTVRPPAHSRDEVANWFNPAWQSRQFICSILFFLLALLSASFSAHATLANFRADCGSSGCHLNGLPAGTAVANGPNFNTSNSSAVFTRANAAGMGSSATNIAAIVAYIESVRPTITNNAVTFNTAKSIAIPDLYFNSLYAVINDVQIVSAPMAGASVTKTIAGNAGTFLYTPKANFCGNDSWTYQGIGPASAATTIRTATVTISCPPSPVITSGTTASGTAGVLFGGYTVTASNSPTSFSASGLPPGLNINTSSGLISGTPTTGGTFNATVSASNANPTAGTQTVTFTIIPASPVITSGATATGTIGTVFTGYTITATNTPTSFSAIGLPPGLSVTAGTGAIIGTPTSTGTFTATVSASNANPTPGTRTVTFTIFPAIPVITSGTAVSGTVGTAITPYQITATNSPTTFTAPGLPGGLSINATGLISGTPTVAGTFNVTVSAANTNPTAGTQTVVFTIVPPIPVISSAATASGQTGVLLSPTYTITASNSPTIFAATGLPPGLTINTSSGVISGTPTALGVFNVALTAQNANPRHSGARLYHHARAARHH
jgi:Putative Ig domain